MRLEGLGYALTHRLEFARGSGYQFKLTSRDGAAGPAPSPGERSPRLAMPGDASIPPRLFGFVACFGRTTQAYFRRLDTSARPTLRRTGATNEQPSSSPRRPSMYWTRKPSTRSRGERRRASLVPPKSGPDGPFFPGSTSAAATTVVTVLMSSSTTALLARSRRSNRAWSPPAATLQSTAAAQKPRFPSRTALSLAPQLSAPSGSLPSFGAKTPPNKTNQKEVP